MKKQRKNPTREQREIEDRRFKEWNLKHKTKLDGVLSHSERTEYRSAVKGNRE